MINTTNKDEIIYKRYLDKSKFEILDITPDGNCSHKSHIISCFSISFKKFNFFKKNVIIQIFI